MYSNSLIKLEHAKKACSAVTMSVETLENQHTIPFSLLQTTAVNSDVLGFSWTPPLSDYSDY